MPNVPLKTLYENIRARGWSFVWRTLQRDRMDAAFHRSRPSGDPLSPGALLEVAPLPSGQRFTFENAGLELEIIDSAIARFTWIPGVPTPPYALAGADWPEVEVRTWIEGEVHWLESSHLRIAVHADGSLHWYSRLPSGAALLRSDLPPQRAGECWISSSPTSPGESFYGLGEQSGPFNLRGQVRRCWNTDPGGSYGPGADPLYMPIPVYAGKHAAGAYLIFYENSFPSKFDFASGSDSVQASFESGQLRGYFIPGPLPRCLEHYTALTGRAPLPPLWSLGLHQSRWGYKDEADIRQVAEGYRQHNLPLSAIHLDIDYMHGYRVFSVDSHRFPDLPRLADELAASGIRLVTILDPGVKVDSRYDVFRSGLEQRSFVSDDGSNADIGLVWPGPSAYPDFTAPAGRRWWGSFYPRLLDAGVAGIWHDMNEPTNFVAWGDPTLPLSLRHDLDGQGGSHFQAHNLYAFQMNRAGYEALRTLRPQRRPWLLSRSGWAGQQRYAWNWTGDTETSWPVLRMTLATVLGLGLSGFPYTGSDIGGFSGSPDAELMLRWFQLAALMPFFRIHSAAGTSRREPWTFGEPAISIMRATIHLRLRLLPYIYTLAWNAAQTGAPLLRPLLWEFPQDERFGDTSDCFLLGDALLVAPVLDPGAVTRKLLLPEGLWYDFWSAARFEGPGEIELPAPLDRLPLLVRGGALLPLKNAGDVLELHYFPGSTLHAALLYSDLGDGYADSRLDSFTREPGAAGETRLRWSATGGFPLPQSGIPLVVHAASLVSASLDGESLPVQDAATVLPVHSNGEKTLSLMLSTQ